MQAAKIARVPPRSNPTVSEWSVPSGSGSEPTDITSANGQLWYVLKFVNKVGRLVLLFAAAFLFVSLIVCLRLQSHD